MVRGHQHGLVAGDVGLRRQHVHALRARGARCGFERERGDGRTGHARVVLDIEGIEHAYQHGARLDLGALGVVRCTHLQHQLGAEGIGSCADARASGFERRVGNAGAYACASLHRDLMPLGNVLLDGLRGGGDACLACPRFLRDADMHRQFLL
ncbi:hypothetical protein D3C81_1401880 [compost metagenome]